MLRYIGFIFVALCIPLSLYAQVTITEIMYDLEGSDSGREWVEVFNDGASAVNLSLWRLYEAQTNHKIISVQGGDIIGVGVYGIIADNSEKFLVDNPDFSGLLFDSSFKLKQEGEVLILRDGDLVDQDTVTYTPDDEADNTGLSLHKLAGSWLDAVPSPGIGASVESTKEISTTEVSTPIQLTGSVSPLVPEGVGITVSIIDRELLAVVGAATTFEALALGLKNTPLAHTRYLWNFGDGSMAEGELVMHTYNHKGEYVVIVDASSAEYSAMDRVVIKVVEAVVEISLIGDTSDFFIELHNTSDYELNLSGWILQSGNEHFIVPRNTFILPHKKLVIGSDITQFAHPIARLSLLYPNGDEAYKYIGPTYIPKVTTLPVKKEVLTPAVVRTPVGNAVVIERGILEDTKTEEVVSNEIQSAVAYNSVLDNKTQTSLFAWFTALFALIFFVVIGVFASRKKSNLADEFMIVEED